MYFTQAPSVDKPKIATVPTFHGGRAFQQLHVSITFSSIVHHTQ